MPLGYNLRMTKRLKTYLDTSIFNFAISTQVVHERQITLKFLHDIKRGIFLPFISDIFFEEIQKASPEKRDALVKIAAPFDLESLPLTEEAEALADRYVQEMVIPKKYRNDALHIAIASVYNMDVIVSWNFEHMVKLKTRRAVHAINTLMGFKPIDICSPQELI